MNANRNRIVKLMIIISLQFVYFPLNRLLHGGYLPRIPLDDMVPFWPAWAITYLLGIFWWAACYFWATWKMTKLRYRAFFVSTVFMLLTSYAFFVLFPTYVERPSAEGVGWQFDLIRQIFKNDRVNNAFPSGHTYNTMLITLFWWNWYPAQRWLWAVITIIVILSTVFTGQHNLVDPLGGILWAWGSYRFGCWWTTRAEQCEVVA